MLSLSKKTDYALIALNHMGALQEGEIATAKEIAAVYRVPQELLAKILQRLAKEGLVQSVSGPKGGYALARSLEEMTVGEVVRAIEGDLQFTRCEEESLSPCDHLGQCTVRTPLQRIHFSVAALLDSMTLKELLSPDEPRLVRTIGP